MSKGTVEGETRQQQVTSCTADKVGGGTGSHMPETKRLARSETSEGGL